MIYINKIKKILIGNELGELSKVLVSMHNLDLSYLNDGIYDEYINCLDECTERVAKAIQCIEYEDNYKEGIIQLDGIDELFSKLLSFKVQNNLKEAQ